MNTPPPPIDVFECGDQMLALGVGTVHRVERWVGPHPIPTCWRIHPATAGEFYLTPPGPPGPALALHAIAAGGRTCAIRVDRVVGLGLKPARLVPWPPELARFCGLDCVAGLVTWSDGEALLVRLAELIAHVERRNADAPSE